MSRRPASLTVAFVLLALGLRWVWNSNEWSGPVVMTLTPSHGVHLNDWLTIVLWAFAITTAFPVWVRLLTLRLRSAVSRTEAPRFSARRRRSLCAPTETPRFYALTGNPAGRDA